MRSWAQRAMAWAGQIFGDGTEEEPASAGRDATLPGRVATLVTEAQLSEALCHGGSPPPGQAAAQAASTVTNAFGTPLAETIANDERGIVALSTGLAAAGVRTAAFIAGDGIGASRTQLTHAARRRLALVVHSSTPHKAGHEGHHAVADTGAALAMARDAQHAADLTLLGRRLAEEALLPVVLSWDGDEHEQRLKLPEPALVRAFVGAPDDEVSSTVAAQTRVFDGPRRRLPRWFDPDRPVAQGSRLSGPGLDAALAGKTLFYDAPAGALLDKAAAELRELTGRDAGPLWPHRLNDAKHVIVGQGAVLVTAAEAADRRREAGQDAGVLGLTWLRPLAADALRDALSDATMVTVLERTAAPLGAEGALLREVAAVLAGRKVQLLSARYGLGGQLPTSAELEQVFANMADAAHSALHLGLTPADTAGAGPRREVLLQEAARLAPALSHLAVPQGAERPPEGGRSDNNRPPMAVRQLAGEGTGWHGVARFWGESYQPLQGRAGTTPEPYLALDALPPATATFRDRTTSRTQAPAIKLSACTGCGVCWTACPDAAIAPVAASTVTMLDAAADRAGHDSGDAMAGKLRRAHKQLANRMDGQLAKSGGRILDDATAREAHAWLADKMGIGEEDRAAFDGAFEATLSALNALPAAATEGWFHLPHGKKKGDGALLALAVSPQSCQGCGLCESTCAEDAISMVDQTEAKVAAMSESWAAWEAHPDTAGALISRAGEIEGCSTLAGLMLSRHCLLTAPGGDDAEPGSGARLAARLVTAVAEFHGQGRVQQRARDLDDLGDRLRSAVEAAIVGATAGADLADLEGALEGLASRSAKAADVLSHLDALGKGGRLDGVATGRMARAAHRVSHCRWLLGEGSGGTGRARHGVVLAGANVARWAATFPHNAFSVPLVADESDSAVDHAMGLARGLALAHTDEMRSQRLAALALEAPSDLPARERATLALGWSDLDDDERALCAPVLLFGDAAALMEGALPGLRRLLAGDLPVKVVLLDERSLPLGGADPTMLGLATRRVPVAATSIAHFDHILEAVNTALNWAGPALLHVHTPAPKTHGFAPELTLERAGKAVAARVHPLLRYDPGAKGAFGSRMDLSGNPEPAEDQIADEQGALTVQRWAAGETRFEGLDLELAIAERAGHWATLRELAGLRTPFTGKLRAEIEAELAAAHAAELAAQKAEFEGQMAAQVAAQAAENAALLKGRLLQLAGYAAGEGDKAS